MARPEARGAVIAKVALVLQVAAMAATAAATRVSVKMVAGAMRAAVGAV